jgi:dTDP-4-amino-4,6-dideoxygalactose transaminase
MIKLIKPYITFDEVMDQFKAVFDSGWLTKGIYVDQFKKALMEFTNVGYAHLTTSATTALSSCLDLLKVGEGDEVIVSDFSFPATANIVEAAGARPVFADVDPETFNMRPEELKKKITERTKAVIFVDALGNPSGIHEIVEICKTKKIPLIEDAACALGSSENGKKCGEIADLTCFSFHPRKLLTTGEGGAIVTDREDWNEYLKIKLEHGAKVENGVFDFVDYGFNYRLSELQAVMGLVQIKKLDSIVASRIMLQEEFTKRLMPAGYRPQKIGNSVRYNVQSLVFVVPNNISRDGLRSYLKDEGIETTFGTYCLSGCTYYRNKYKDVQPIAEELQRSTVTFPCHDEVDPVHVCNKVLQFGEEK